MEYQVTFVLCAVSIALAIVTVRGILRGVGHARPCRGWLTRRVAHAVVQPADEPGSESLEAVPPLPSQPMLRILPLSRTAAQAFMRSWLDARALAKTNLQAAVVACDRLLGEVMCTLGYPLGDLDSYAEELSQNHAPVMRHYVEAHGLAIRHAAGSATGEDLVRAMSHFEELFEHFLLPTRSDLRTA